MSRSYKKRPFCTDGHRKSTQKSKKCANKVVKHYKKGLPNGSAYKKLFCSYDIHDYINRWSWKEARQEYLNNDFWQEEYPTLKQFYQFWKKYYKRK